MRGGERGRARLALPEGAGVELLAPDLALLSLPLPEAALPEALSEAEQQIALHVYAGASNEDIAAARQVSVKTVDHQLQYLYRKLGVASRDELVLLLRGKPRR